MYKEEKKEIKSWWWFFVGLIALTIIVFSGMKYMGMIGTTVVERVVFENSFQYKEGMKQKSRNIRSKYSRN